LSDAASTVLSKNENIYCLIRTKADLHSRRMSDMTVTLGADITALKRGMAAAAQLVAVSARRMGAIGACGLAGIGRGGAAGLEGGFRVAGMAGQVFMASVLDWSEAAGAGIKAVTAVRR
jgi:hypothetical protein